MVNQHAPEPPAFGVADLEREAATILGTRVNRASPMRLAGEAGSRFEIVFVPEQFVHEDEFRTRAPRFSRSKVVRARRRISKRAPLGFRAAK
jgi:hypothetical protein